jgi:hypothetical protein
MYVLTLLCAADGGWCVCGCATTRFGCVLPAALLVRACALCAGVLFSFASLVPGHTMGVTVAEAVAQWKTGGLNSLSIEQLRVVIAEFKRAFNIPDDVVNYNGPDAEDFNAVRARLAELEAERRNKVIGLLLVAGAMLYWRRRQRA